VSNCAAAKAKCSRAASRLPHARQISPHATCVRAASKRALASSSKRTLSARCASASSIFPGSSATSACAQAVSPNANLIELIALFARLPVCLPRQLAGVHLGFLVGRVDLSLPLPGGGYLMF